MFISNNRMPKSSSLFLRFTLLLLTVVSVAETMAQVSSVQFGKNRIQYRKYNWRFYQTDNFNIHFTEGGLELAKYVLQVAEEELPQLEQRANRLAEKWTEQRNALDLLYHEATFLDDLRERADYTFHSTALQAAELASGAQVNKLLLGHFSVRYKDLTPLLEEAKQVFMYCVFR